MRTCCFCFDLRSGSLASGIFTLVINIIVLIGNIIALVLLLKGATFQVLTFHKAMLGCAIATSSLMSIFSVLLLIGVQKDIPRLFLPWSAVIGFQIGICFIVLCITIPILGTGLYPVLITVSAPIGVVFCIYMLWCISAYHKLLSTVAAVPSEVAAINNHPVQFKDGIPLKLEKDAKLLV